MKWPWTNDSVLLTQILKVVNKMSLDITALQNAVANETAVEQSVPALLGTLSAEIKTLAGETVDPATKAALDDLTVKINNNAAALSAAVVANTPAIP